MKILKKNATLLSTHGDPKSILFFQDAKGNDPVNVVARPPASIPGLEDLHGNYSSLTGVATIRYDTCWCQDSSFYTWTRGSAWKLFQPHWGSYNQV